MSWGSRVRLHRSRYLDGDNATRRQRVCTVRNCAHQGREFVREQRFCRLHARLYREHYEIVEKIRSL